MRDNTKQGHSSTHQIHVLHAGQMICGRFPGAPISWPDGHLFVRAPDGPAPLPACVNCPECIQRWQQHWGKHP